MQIIYHCLRNANSREQPGCGHQAAKCEILRIIMRAELDAKRAICVIINLGHAFANWPCLISTCTGCLVWRLFHDGYYMILIHHTSGFPSIHLTSLIFLRTCQISHILRMSSICYNDATSFIFGQIHLYQYPLTVLKREFSLIWHNLSYWSPFEILQTG